MRHQLARQSADIGAPEAAFKLGESSARKIERHLGTRLVHRQHEAIAADARLGAERASQPLPEGECAVLDGVVLVDVQIPAACELEGEATMLRELLEHVIEET